MSDSTSGPSAGDEDVAADFARRFAEAWADPTPDRLCTLFTDQIRLVAPMTPTTTGIDPARQSFAQLFELIPDLTGEVHRFGPHPDGVFIEFTLSGTLGGKPIAWRAVDDFLLTDGLATERVSYFDPMPIVGHALRNPGSWPRAVPGLFRLRTSR